MNNAEMFDKEMTNIMLAYDELDKLIADLERCPKYRFIKRKRLETTYVKKAAETIERSKKFKEDLYRWIR